MLDTPSENTASEQPLWSRANDTLNLIREDLLSRAATIEGEQKRLAEEHSHVLNALNRIQPPTPEPMGMGSIGYAEPKSSRRW